MNPASFLDAQAHEINADDELIRRAQRWAFEQTGSACRVHFAFTLPHDREMYASYIRRGHEYIQTIAESGCLFVLRQTEIRGIYGGKNGHNRYICQHHGEELIAGWVEC